MIDVLLEAAEELGYKVGDINGELEDEGFTRSQVTLRDGSRTGTFRAFAEKYVGDKLSVLTHAHVNKVIIEGSTAVGVEVSRFGRVETYLASQEVVLSAGSIGSPQILMLSGVGDRDHLLQVGVTPVLHLPDIGQNLQDHLITSIIFDTEQPLSMDVLGASSPSAVLQYLSGENHSHTVAIKEGYNSSRSAFFLLSFPPSLPPS